MKSNLAPLRVPKAFHGDMEVGIIVLENLKLQGYVSPPRSAKGKKVHFLRIIE